MITEEIKLARKSGLGGSDIASLLGIGFKSPVELWLDKTGRAPAQEENLAMTIGNALEDTVANLYEKEKGVKTQNYHMVQDGIFIANLDKLVVPAGQKVASHKDEIRTNKALECKTSSQAEWETIPDYYVTQVQWYMGVIPQIEVMDLACLFLGKHKVFKVYTEEKNQEQISLMQEIATEWWQKHIVEGVPPTPESESDCKAIWKASKPTKVTIADVETIASVERLKGIREQIKELETQESQELTNIYAAMQDAEELVTPDNNKLCSWKSSKAREVIDWEKLAMSLNPAQELINQYTTTKEGHRTFRLK